MSKNIYRILFMPIILLFGTSVHAGIFKWVDTNGLTHYSDKPPQKYQSQTVNMGGTDSTKQPTAVQQSQKVKVFYDIERISNGLPKKEVMQVATPEVMPEVLTEAMPDLDAVEYDLRDVPKKVEQKSLSSIKRNLCSGARTRLAALKEEGFASYFDEDENHRLAWGGDNIYQGERLYLTDKQVAKLGKETSFEVEAYCAYPDDQKLQDEARANWIRSEYCAVSKAYLEDLERPDMRTTDNDISNQTEAVERFCAELKPGEHRNDDDYYPMALRPKHIIKPAPTYNIRWD